ncbi:hypothetical protein IPM09_01450 [Candidatus Saccharibacteria bacterium]|nr:MAG: hypothetical protein IPM09_01450 [Candidatus Saccharibacteria bacterium]
MPSYQQPYEPSASVGITGATRIWALLVACGMFFANGFIAFAGLIGFVMNDTGSPGMAIAAIGVLVVSLLAGIANIALFILQGIKVSMQSHTMHRRWVVGLTIFGGVVISVPFGFYVLSVAESVF